MMSLALSFAGGITRLFFLNVCPLCQNREKPIHKYTSHSTFHLPRYLDPSLVWGPFRAPDGLQRDYMSALRV